MPPSPDLAQLVDELTARGWARRTPAEDWIDAQLELDRGGETTTVSVSSEYESCTLDIELPGGTVTLSFPLEPVAPLPGVIAAAGAVQTAADLAAYREVVEASSAAADIALGGDYMPFTEESLQLYVSLAGDGPSE